MKKNNTSIKKNADGTKTVWNSDGYNGKLPAKKIPKASLNKPPRTDLKPKKENSSEGRDLHSAYDSLAVKTKRNGDIKVGQILTPEHLLLYLKETNRAQAKKTQVVLKILLNYPEGLPRCCLREALREKGIDVGQPAAQVRDLRSAGVNIPILTKAKCAIHNKSVTIDHIQTPYIVGNEYASAK